MKHQRNSQPVLGFVLVLAGSMTACASLDSEEINSRTAQLSDLNGVDWNGVDWNGVDWNGVDWNGVDWNGVDWNGVDWNGVDWNGVDWNGVDWNGVDWNGVDWNGVDWNGVDWNGADANSVDWGSIDWQGQRWDNVDWQRVTWDDSEWKSGSFKGIADHWAGLGWFMNGADEHGVEVGAFVITNPAIRSWVSNSATPHIKEQRMHLLGKMVEGSACPGWPVLFGDDDGNITGWQGRLCLAPSMWTLGPQDQHQLRFLSAYIISLFNTTSLQLSLRAPVATMATNAAERSAFSVAQACYAGNLFQAEPVIKAFAIQGANAPESAFAARACRVGTEILAAVPMLSFAGDESFMSDICGIEWTQAAQEVPLAGYENGDDSATLRHCDAPNQFGEVAGCRTFEYDQRNHSVEGDIFVATSVDEYPTVCAYLAPN